jgi:broad specificity polyphosphatase/5'/3'-nucleotidase SurE
MIKKLNNILISNDDGYESVGLKVLLNIAEQLANNVFIVSPKKKSIS